MVLRLLAEEGGQMQSQERRRPLSVHGGVGGGSGAPQTSSVFPSVGEGQAMRAT